MPIVIGSGIRIDGGVSLAAPAAGVSLIAASSLTSQAFHIQFNPTVYFFIQSQANAFYAANPSTYYIVDADGTQTEYAGVTLGAVTPSGPYWGITASGGAITVGTYLSGASKNIYF